LGHGLSDAVVRHQLAQSLVDRGNPAAARLIYQGILGDPDAPEHEWPEALGGIGRCYNQLYLLDRVTWRRRRHMRAAIDAYKKAYDADHDSYWHGINLVALLARAGRDGVEVAGVEDPLTASVRLVHEVLAVVRGVPSPGVWELATACEAGVALGDHELAISRATMLVSRADVDAFTVASLLRQLLELWELSIDELPGQILVPLLRSAVLGRDGGGLGGRSPGCTRGPICRHLRLRADHWTVVAKGLGPRAVPRHEVVAHWPRAVPCRGPDREQVL